MQLHVALLSFLLLNLLSATNIFINKPDLTKHMAEKNICMLNPGGRTSLCEWALSVPQRQPLQLFCSSGRRGWDSQFRSTPVLHSSFDSFTNVLGKHQTKIKQWGRRDQRLYSLGVGAKRKSCITFSSSLLLSSSDSDALSRSSSPFSSCKHTAYNLEIGWMEK